MASARPLSTAFRAARGPAPDTRDTHVTRVTREADAELESALAGAVARAREDWPASSIDGEAFARFLGERVAPEALVSARVADLASAFACLTATGERRDAVLATVESRYFREVDAALGKMGLSADRASEVKQSLRQSLFVGDGARAPRVAEYRGAGDLKAWLRVTAMRAALKLLRKDGRETPASDDAVLEARSTADDPELSYMKAAYRAAFRAAFQEALDSLEARERTLLKQQVVDGLSIDDLGALHGVHRATAARWVASAKDKLLARTRRAFMTRARIDKDECESIMRLVQSQLDVSLHRRLRA